MADETVTELQPYEFGLGDIPVDSAHYDRHMMSFAALDSLSDATWDVAELAEFDARTRGWVTPPRTRVDVAPVGPMPPWEPSSRGS